MVERNWRDEFEPKDKLDRKVTDVIYHNGSPWGYMIYTVAMGDFPSTDVHRLIPKPKPKTYRPWKRCEIAVGTILNCHNAKETAMVTVVGENAIRVGAKECSYQYVLDNCTMLDGSPCGVLES